MSRKLSTNPQRGRRNTVCAKMNIGSDLYHGCTKNWEKEIKELMFGFEFSDLQIESVLEKAKAAFLPSDDNKTKYNKAWKFFKLELKSC